jgi:hypothetical protein
MLITFLVAVHPIANELAGTADEKMQHVVRWSMFLCGTIYLCTATFGYLLFGEGTSDDILSNFDTDLGVPFSDVICVIVRISYAVHIMLVFPLLNFSREPPRSRMTPSGSPPSPPSSSYASSSAQPWCLTSGSPSSSRAPPPPCA